MNEAEILHTPKLRHAAIITVIGYVMGWGVPFADFGVIPKLFVADNAAKTAQNIAANHGLFVAAIFAFLINFIGDVVAAWGLYLLLRPVNASISMFLAWLRVVFATIGIAATLNLVTAHRLVTRPNSLTALGQDQINAQVHVAIGSFNSQFAFSLIIFGVYLMMLGWLMYRSGYIPKWLGSCSRSTEQAGSSWNRATISCHGSTSASSLSRPSENCSSWCGSSAGARD